MPQRIAIESIGEIAEIGARVNALAAMPEGTVKEAPKSTTAMEGAAATLFGNAVANKEAIDALFGIGSELKV